MLYSDIAITV